MASLIAKRKKHKLYYYVVNSARVQGRPRIVHQTYLGSAKKVAALLKERTAPLPLSATRRELGLPGALWLAAQQSGVFALLQSLWEPPRSGPSPAHCLLLAAMHRICPPRCQGRRGRLVSADHPRSPLGLRAGAILLPGLRGLLRTTPAGERSFGAKRRT